MIPGAAAAFFLVFSCAIRASADGTVSISILTPLSFGKIAAGAGGSVTVTPAGTRSKSGGVAILSSGSGSSGRFRLSGPNGQSYILTLPADEEAMLNSDSSSMTLSNFTVDPESPGSLDGAGERVISVGATLNIDSSKPPGDYMGNFTVLVESQ